MHIHVTLAGPLSKYGNGSRHQIIQAGPLSTLKDVLDVLKIPEDKYSFAVINGEKSDELTTLHDGDSITIYPMVSGG